MEAVTLEPRSVELSLSQLQKCCAATLAFIWTLHLNVRGSGFYYIHEMLDEVYKELIEHNDRIAECAIKNGETVTITVNAPEINNISIKDAIDQAVIALNEFCEKIVLVKNYDIGVDNMLGDIYEKVSKWANYFILRHH